MNADFTVVSGNYLKKISKTWEAFSDAAEKADSLPNTNGSFLFS